MKVLILGGCGFLGQSLTQEFVKHGIEVRVFDRAATVACLVSLGGVEYHGGDFAALQADNTVFDDIDAVIHLVSTTVPSTSMQDMAWDVSSNILPSINLLQIMVARGIRRLLFFSSGGTVYGVPETIPVNESHVTEPISSYGITKLAIEKYILLFNRIHGLQGTILRLSNPYGVFQLRGTVIGSIAAFVRKHAAGEIIDIWGDGQVVRDYIFINDVTAAARMIVQNREFPQGTYNLGSGVGHTLLDILETLGLVSGKLPRVRFTAARGIDVPKIVLDISHLRQMLPDWSVTVDISEGMARLWHSACV